MADLLAVYTLGTKGVNLVDDPLVLDDADLTSAQNCQTSPNESDSGILKRGGLGRLVTVAGGLPILAVISVPFTDPSPGTIIEAGYPPLAVGA
jgi:hypothetical protein